MSVRLIDRDDAPSRPPSRPTAHPDPGFESLASLTQLRDRLAIALAKRSPGRWNEPPIFFFDPRRQADLEAIQPVAPANPFADLGLAIVAELPDLYASVEVRRVARAIDGLRTHAEALAAVCPDAKELADLLAIPDDEVVAVLHPGRRAGVRIAVRGVSDIGQFHILLADATAGDQANGLYCGAAMPARFTAACRNVNPASPAGVPMVAEARWQMYMPAALNPDGTLPAGFGGCEHWLWPTTALASLPRTNGERVVLIGPPAFAATWEVSRRFPQLPAGLRVIEALSPFRVAERLSQLTGTAVSPALPSQAEDVLARAA